MDSWFLDFLGDFGLFCFLGGDEEGDAGMCVWQVGVGWMGRLDLVLAGLKGHHPTSPQEPFEAENI